MAQNRFAIAFAAEAAAEYGMSRETFDPSGKINAAATARGMKLNLAFGQSLKSAGEKHCFPRCRRNARHHRNELLSRRALYARRGHDPAGRLHPRASPRGLAPKVDMFEHSPVTSLKREGGNWTAATRRGEPSAAPKVIVAVNGHIEDFGSLRRAADAHLRLRVDDRSVSPPMISVAGMSGRDRWALLPADAMGATVRKITSGGQSRIVIRTKYTYDTTITVSGSAHGEDGRRARHSFDARFPGLAGMPFEYSWAGRLCLSLNHVPAFGEIEEGLYSACCENGLGTVKSTLAGMMAADLATDTRSRHA